MSFDIKKFTLGIEEEYMICDPKSGDLVDRAKLIMDHFKDELADRFSFELIEFHWCSLEFIGFRWDPLDFM